MLGRALRWLCLLVALAAALLGAASAMGVGRVFMPPPVAVTIAGVFGLFFVVSLLPLRARRVSVFLIALVVIGGLAGGLYYFQFFIKPNMIKGFISAAFVPKPTSVSAEAAKKEPWAPHLNAIGTARAFQGVEITPQVGGLVSAIHFESGDNVEEGTLLVDLDDSVEQADLKNGLAQLANANATLDRQKTLVMSGNTPQSSVDAAIAARDSAAATVERSRAVIAQKAIRAPFAGRLGLRNVDLGQYVSVGAMLVTLQRLDPIDVDFPAPEEALSRLAVGQEVTMTVDAVPGRTFTGRVKAIDARVSADSRNIVTRAEFANPDRVLLPGMFANLTVTTGEPVETLTVPRTAIVFSLYGDNAFVVKPAPPKADGGLANGGLVAERRFVKLGDTRGERIAVLSGLQAGDRVVTSGQIKLLDNSPVVVDETNPLPAPPTTPLE